MLVSSKNYYLEYTDNGLITEFGSHEDSCNLIKNGSKKFGQPILGGTQTNEGIKRFKEVKKIDKNRIQFCRKECSAEYVFKKKSICVNMVFSEFYTPRMGVNLDLRFLDTDKGNAEDKLMMTECYVPEDKEYAYFLFRRYDGKYFGIIVKQSFGAYRLNYSYFGHRVTGFQLLCMADDLICSDQESINRCKSIHYEMFFADSLVEAKEFVCEILEIAIPQFDMSGGVVGSTIELKHIGRAEEVTVEEPDGEAIKLTKVKGEGTYEVKLIKAGVHNVILKGKRESKFQLLAHDKISQYYEKVCNFNVNYFQHETGAFYRAIDKKSLKPENFRTFEGVHFGNPFERMSCRTGEFGGVAAWSVIKQMKYSHDSKLRESARKYLEDWALNRQGDSNGFGTICREKQIYGFKSYSPYHLYKEANFPQYEIFLLEQMVDYYEVNPKKYILEDIIGLAEHFVRDHVKSGRVDYHGVDYTSVHTPVIAYVKVGKLLINNKYSKKGESFLNIAEEMCRHLASRRDDFPTEGERCTEDGSIACSALQLLYYCYHIEHVDEFLFCARKLLEIHRMLEFTLPDSRMYMSSIRFWETLYETRDYGPSYNCGHAWSMWISEAKFYMGLITSDIKWFQESFCGIITNMCKVEENGGMTCCYTPDIIPGIPHHYFLWRYDIRGGFKRDKKAYLGSKYSEKSYSSSGNYFLVKYAETFDWVSALDIGNDKFVNMLYEDGKYKSLGRDFKLLILDNLTDREVVIATDRTIAIQAKTLEKIYSDNMIIRKDKLVVKPENGLIRIRCSR